MISKLPVQHTRLLTDPVRPWVYAHNGGSSIDVYNVYTATKIATFSHIAVAMGAMAIAPDGSALYVIDTSAKQMWVIDPVSGTKVRAFSLVYAANAGVAATYLRTNGVGVVMLGDGTAYLASDGSALASGSTLFGGSAALTAGPGGNQVFLSGPQGSSPAYPGIAAVDYTAINGGSFLYNTRSILGASNTPVASNAMDVAVSQDGARFYSAAGAPYACLAWDAKTGGYAGSLPGGDAYPNNVEVGSDGRIYCGISGWYSKADVWMYSTSGTLLHTFKFAGYAHALVDRSFVVSGDGLVGIALTDDPLMAFLPLGP
ncbi:MAG: hypothetical protein EOO27_42910 [Comamonadaceae bacterium]|nr:MAG: hypothetical protein EOO27_42910 [Comamonadaceae bacterium]